MNFSKPSSIAVKVLMWISWSLVLYGVAALLFFINSPKPEVNNWFSTEFFWVSFISMDMMILLAVRFLAVSKIKNPWLKLLVYWFGLFVTQSTFSSGLFMFTEGQHTYFFIGFISLLAYLPLWIATEPKAKSA